MTLTINPMRKNLDDFLEKQELLDKLTDQGYGKLVEVLLMNESKCYTRSGRLNKSGACRILQWKPKQLEDALNKCREILKDDISL